MSFLSYFNRVLNRENLTAEDAESFMDLVLAGDIAPAQLGGMLVALRMKGEVADEIYGFARALRTRALRIPIDGPLLDTCGTGGDGAMTFNVSTVAALVAAGAGVRVAKHGNRSMSSQCGSADILEGFGVRVVLAPEDIADCIRQTGFGFMFAPAIHPAVRHAQSVRAELKIRTVFNLLGPLTNPAGATAQLVGTPSVRSAELVAEALAMLGLEHGFVVHGSDGLDEITTTGDSLVLEIRKGAIGHRTVTPEDFGVKRATPADLKGADRQVNCNIAERILSGERGAARDIVVVNASAAIVAAGLANSFAQGAEIAAAAIDSGAASRVLNKVVEFTANVGQAATARSN